MRVGMSVAQPHVCIEQPWPGRELPNTCENSLQNLRPYTRPSFLRRQFLKMFFGVPRFCCPCCGKISIGNAHVMCQCACVVCVCLKKCVGLPVCVCVGFCYRAANIIPGGRAAHRPRGVTVSTLDSESNDRGSNPREALLAVLLAGRRHLQTKDTPTTRSRQTMTASVLLPILAPQ